MSRNVQSELIETLARDLANRLQCITHCSDQARDEFAVVLVEFAEEIKLQAVEPS